MGYLTTITFRNDHIHELKERHKETMDAVFDACMDSDGSKDGQNKRRIGRNGLICQKTRHADDTTLFMHAGNTVVEVHEAADNEWATKKFIEEMTYHLKRLKQIQKERYKK